MFRGINTAITRQFGKGWKVAAFGSFIGLRADDPDGAITVKKANEVMWFTAKLLKEAGFTNHIAPMNGIAYHMCGVVANWSRHHV